MAINLLIDTGVLIDYLREQGDAVRYLESMKDKPLISVITVAELYAGVREGKERKRLDKFISAFEVVLVDLNISVKGGLFRGDYGKSHNTGIADALIAATADTQKASLVTLNAKHFPMLKNVIIPYHKEKNTRWKIH